MASTGLRTLDGADIEIGDAAIEAFAGRLHGRLVRPADTDYDDARAVWNGLIDRLRPAATCLGCPAVAGERRGFGLMHIQPRVEDVCKRRFGRRMALLVDLGEQPRPRTQGE
jgi:hypothetical protein